MPLLTPGTTITVSDGSSLTVIAYIKAGGQGEIYRITHHPSGKTMALKWYIDNRILRNSAFRHSLWINCGLPAPSKAFLWPKAVTERYNGHYGYIMELKPDGYLDMGEYFCLDRNPEAYMRSWLAKINAALQISDAFATLHQQGFSYQDINDGSFMINPYTGHVRICDNDNVVQNGMSHGIAGKQHYMAPEVANGNHPTIESDRFSLAIILYRLLAIDHPFEGVNTCSPKYACLTPADDLFIFGNGAVFCYDDFDNRNRPNERLQPNSVLFWPMLTPRLQNAFKTALGRSAIREPSVRVKARHWRTIAIQERAGLVTCNADAEGEPHDFFCQGEMPRTCPLCGRNCGPEAFVIFESGLKYRLTVGKPLYFGASVDAAGLCRKGGSQYGAPLILENTSGNIWRINTPNGRSFDMPNGSYCPLISGLSITSGNTRLTVL